LTGPITGPARTSAGARAFFSYAKRQLQGVDALGDLFAFPNALNIPKHPSNDERPTSWPTSSPMFPSSTASSSAADYAGREVPPGCRVSGAVCGKGTTGNQYQRGDSRCPGLSRTGPSISGSARISPASGHPARDHAGCVQHFNHDNFGCYAVGNRNDLNFGDPTCSVSDPRRFVIGAEYDF